MKLFIIFLFLFALLPLHVSVVFADEVLLQYVDNIRELLEQSRIKYAEGDVEEAKRLAMKAYIDNYEYLEDPVEDQNEELNDELEIMLREELQALMRQNAPLEQVEEKIDAILERITIVETIVPEFNSLVSLVLITAIIPVILLSKMRSSVIRY
ncbi:MAG: hypothetical protein KGZ37_08440 [Nitrosarchaeum sp.]|nr:hypothetical protein [Nitrosarchaeum sp.]